ncbi:hypothetical protein AKO1_013217 [Acrasis kona]|uniref:Uncharacterized protein n=1 Tax=Acrasis kona TaxID=1008807 RepID=A0AAW2YZK5_9EUKA
MDLKKLLSAEKTISDNVKRQQIANTFQKLLKEEHSIVELDSLNGFPQIIKMLSEGDQIVKKRISACIVNMTCVDSTLVILRKNNIIQALVERLADESETLLIAENVAAAFMNLCINQENRQYIADNVPQALSAILKTCRKCTDDPSALDEQREEIVYNMMLSLSGLALNTNALTELSRLEAPEYISNIVIDDRYDGNNRVVESAIAALWNITLQKEHRKSILRNKNLFEKLIQRLVNLSSRDNPAVKKNASNVLQIMATEEQSQQLLLSNSADTIPRMIKDLSSSDLEVVKSSAGTLWNMGKSEEIRIKIREEAGVDALVKSLFKHFDKQSDPSVIYKLTGSIVACSLDDGSSIRMGELGLVEVLFDILHKYETINDSTIQQNALSALNNLAIQQSNRELINNMNGIKVLIDFLSSKSNDQDLTLAEKASNVLTNLAIDDVGSNAIRECGGIQKLVNLVTLQESKNNNEARKKASGALWNLALNDANLAEIENQGGIKPLAEFLPQVNGELEEILVNKNKNRITIADETDQDEFTMDDDEDDDEEDEEEVNDATANNELFVPITPTPSTIEMTPLQRSHQRRENAIRYLHESEGVYMKLLETIDKLYMSNTSQLIKNNLMTKDVHSSIFQDIDCLRMINKDFYTELDRMVKDYQNTGRKLYDMRVGQLFMKRAPTFRLYKTYVNNMKRSLDTLSDKERKSTPLQTFMNDTKAALVQDVNLLRTMTSRFLADSDLTVNVRHTMNLTNVDPAVNVQDILLKIPIERVNFYLVWLRSQHTERGHADHDSIRDADKQISIINEYCIKKIEELHKLEQFKEMLQHFAPLSQAQQTAYMLDKNCGFPLPTDPTELHLFNAWHKSHLKSKSSKKWSLFKGDVGDPKTTKDVKKLVIKYGISTTHRSKAWIKISGASKLMAENTGYYKRILGVHSNQANASWFGQIEKDLKRTFTNHPLFQGAQGERVTMAMRRILIAYSWRNPLVAYCQSFNYIVGMLLLHLSEEESFWMFVTLIENYLPQNFYSPNLKGVLVDATVLDELIYQNLSKLSTKLKRLEFDISSFTMSFFMKLFTQDFPVQVTLRIWDAMFTFGPVVLFRVTLALLKMNESQLLKTETLSECLLLFQNQIVKQCFDVDKLMKTAFGYSKITPDKIDLLRAKYLPLIESELQKQEEAKELEAAWNR